MHHGRKAKLVMRTGSQIITAFDIVHAMFRMMLVAALTSCAATRIRALLVSSAKAATFGSFIRSIEDQAEDFDHNND